MKIRFLVTLSIALAACGGGDATSTTTTVAAGSEATTTTTVLRTTTTTTAPTTTVAETTTTVAASTADCVVGTWAFDSEAFIAALAENFGGELPGEVSFSGGSYIIELNGDGTMLATRDAWQFRFDAPEGAIVNTIDGTDSGTYSIEGDTITVTTDSSEVSVTVQAEVDGELVALPFGGAQTIDQDTFSGTGSFTCDGDTMTVTFEGTTSVLERV